MTPDEYRNMSPEDEAKLIPDWVRIEKTGSGTTNTYEWFTISGELAFVERKFYASDAALLQILGGFTVQVGQAQVLSDILAFFAAVGHLPRRLQA